MPETIDPPRVPFGARLSETLKPFEAALASKLPDVEKPPVENPPPETGKPAPEVAKTAPEKPVPAPEDRDADFESGKRTPKADDWKRVKATVAETAKQRDELRAKAETFEKELTELRKTPKHNGELIKTLEKERDEFKTKYETVALEWDPEFNAGYKARVDSIIEGVKKLVPADKAEDLAQVLKMPDSDRKRKFLAEIGEELDPFTISEIVLANQNARAVINEREAKLAKSSEGLAAIAKERQSKSEAFKAQREQLFNDVLGKAQGKEGNPAFQVRDGDSPEIKAWNEGVQARTKSAKALFMGEVADESVRAEAAIQSAAVSGITEQLISVTKERDTLKEALAKMQSASPGMQSGAATSKAVKSPEGMFKNAVSSSIRGG